MLRRKLLLVLGGLTGLLVIMAILAIVPLQALFTELDHISNQAQSISARANRLSSTISAIEVELYRLKLGRKHHLDQLIDQVGELRTDMAIIGDHYVVKEPESEPHYSRLEDQMEVFVRHVGALATVQDPQLADQHNIAALHTAADLRKEILQISRYANAHVQDEQAQLTINFRWLVIGMGLGFLLMINISVMVLIRASGIVLRPLEKLVDASQKLAMGRFDHRVELERQDEFDMLGQSFNHLAEQLQQQERRRIEAIGQVAVALNHELNNAIAIIEIQLTMIDRDTDRSPSYQTSMRQVRDNLTRMVQTVDSLKHIRRIVLTDYTDGTKMLDLPRSVETADEVTGEPPLASAPTHIKDAS